MSGTRRPEGCWQRDHGEVWGLTIVRALGTEFPYGAAHQSRGLDDCDVTPWVLHPSFHGCLDWHSSVHMQASAIQLLDQDINPQRSPLSPNTRRALTARLDERLTDEKARVEARYLAAHPGYERPYGWGWAIHLAAVASASHQAGAPQWAGATRRVANQVFENLLAWLPRAGLPVRSGTHDNTAFALGLALDGARALARQDVVDAISLQAKKWFLSDVNAPVSWEPSGHDFLSPSLCEAHLVRRILGDDEFAEWLRAFLPGLGAEGHPLLQVPEVLDRTDGKAVHLFGLELSRTWMLAGLGWAEDPQRVPDVREDAGARFHELADEVNGGDFMSTHWLVSFALQAAIAANF